MPSSVSVLKRAFLLHFRPFLVFLVATLLISLFSCSSTPSATTCASETLLPPRKLGECYLVSHDLFCYFSTKVNPFSRKNLPLWLLQTVILKYIFHTFFLEAAKVLWWRSAALLSE